MILNIGCGGRKGDRDIWYGDYRIDLENYPNVTHVMDAHFLPDIWTDMFDEVVCNIALEHFYNPFKAIGEMKRVLKPTGILKIVVPNVFYWRRIRKAIPVRIAYNHLNESTNIPVHNQAWDLIEMRNLVRQHGLKIINVEYLDWLKDKKIPPSSLLHKIIVYFFLPRMFKVTEVRFTMRYLD